MAACSRQPTACADALSCEQAALKARRTGTVEEAQEALERACGFKVAPACHELARLYLPRVPPNRTRVQAAAMGVASCELGNDGSCGLLAAVAEVDGVSSTLQTACTGPSTPFACTALAVGVATTPPAMAAEAASYGCLGGVKEACEALPETVAEGAIRERVAEAAHHGCQRLDVLRACFVHAALVGQGDAAAASARHACGLGDDNGCALAEALEAAR